MKKQNRRTFIKIAYTGFFVLLIYIWNKMTLCYIQSINKKSKSLQFNQNKKVSFYDDYIVVKNNNEVLVYTAECTHLGCKIHELKNGRLVCPCHGSEYDLNGIPVKGPAFKPLERIPAKIAKDQKSIEFIV